MNADTLALALEKQRLQLKSAALRQQWLGHARGLQPVCAAVDHVGAGLRWLRGHPQALAAGGLAAGVALLVARPRVLWRWTRRSLVVWQAWRKGRAWLARRPAQSASVRLWVRRAKESP
jgi:hypothetical protein